MDRLCMFQICEFLKRQADLEEELDVWKKMRKVPRPPLPWTGRGMRTDSEIAKTIYPEDEIPLLGSFAQIKS